jgi:PilZ domain
LNHAFALIDRRREPRHSVQVQIELREQGGDIPMRLSTTDLSRGGCYIQLMLTLSVGTLVTGKLWLGDSVVRVQGRVVTLHPQFGNAIEFLGFEDDGSQALARYLDQLDAEDILLGLSKGGYQ